MVAGISYDEQALSVVHSLRPYLGARGSGCLIALESLLELLNSEPAQKTLDALQILGPGEGFRELPMRDESPKESKPMTLFLMQALLFLVDVPVSENSTEQEENKPEKEPEISPEISWEQPGSEFEASV